MATELAPAREPDGEKATRIVEAMRASVAERGIAGSTFDQVARAAGVSRGLLHYYFGSKERLLVEAVRRECDLRDELLDSALADAGSAEKVLDVMVRSFEEFLGEGPANAVMIHEMLTLAQRNPEIAFELAELGRRTRSQLGDGGELRDQRFPRDRAAGERRRQRGRAEAELPLEHGPPGEPAGRSRRGRQGGCVGWNPHRRPPDRPRRSAAQARGAGVRERQRHRRRPAGGGAGAAVFRPGRLRGRRADAPRP